MAKQSAAKRELINTGTDKRFIRRHDKGRFKERMMSSAAPVDRRRPRFSHPDRVIYPDVGITKLALARYYEAIGEWMVPHLAGRPPGETSTPFRWGYRRLGGW